MTIQFLLKQVTQIIEKANYSHNHEKDVQMFIDEDQMFAYLYDKHNVYVNLEQFLDIDDLTDFEHDLDEYIENELS